ncbi:sulfatase-like hydrolase/transferase [Roseiconus nitratireducens]|uniref:Sulfatase-like hydrolase/transferase n=1 Tax=Roseiconus nitratireducens TaxID=2605748 RepID=A0A5M6DNM8_9BACT|nr:sulfatase-like hydrolase/transferase [Roseiconus nitratireducens]KAA5547035.1 sulfatase-like hydrolase/transferase [Roseiconus nitratireducens]
MIKSIPIGTFAFFLYLNAIVSAQSQPNIVVLLADDLGWSAVGYHNREFETPHIDSIVRDGMELDQFYVAPMCSPTRAGFMTGRYPIRFGLARAVIPPQRDFGLPTDETTIAEALGELGYEHRGVFGKWHLGHRRAKWHPLNQGFTHFHGHYNGAIDYFDLTREGERDWHTNFDASDEQGYSTDLIAAAAAGWIKQVASEEAPYFCYVPFNAPHSPFQAPDSAVERFERMSPQGQARRDRKSSPVRQTYAAMIWKMDQGIGKILQAIEQSGESDQTIVLFFSDNGGVGKIRDNNAPLRGSKLTVFEGGTRVPACVRWPGHIAPGTKSDARMGYVDLMPTLVALAGGKANSMTDKPLDGIDIAPLLLGEAAQPLTARLESRPWFSYHGQQGEQSEHLAVIHDGWKLKVNGPRLRSPSQLRSGTNQVQLFHLSQDPLEADDLASTDNEQLERLGRLLIDHRALQPDDAVPPYSVGSKGFQPPPKWTLDPEHPNAKVGTDG